jgi:peptidoglycan/xylan/chitin deacetylase (PgdA/CDA1 family)
MNRFSFPGRKQRAVRTWLSRLVVLVLAVGGLASLATPAQAAGPTFVTLEFDNGAISQFTLGYQQALQPHGAAATFFVNSGSVGASGNFVSWAQLSALASAGHDIGGKTVNAGNLTTDPNPTAQVCNDRAAIGAHGLTPVAFAYPGGATNATVQDIVKGCGYGNARGLVSGTETLPPGNWFATRAYAPGVVTLASMQTAVNNAAANGGWVQLVIGRVCSQSLDPTNYTSCSAAGGHVELADLNAFLDWMALAGQPGGAPAGAGISRLSTVVGLVDGVAPTTTIACNGAPCAGTPYSDVVSVTLAATDLGSGVASTHYTLNGSDPTLASPTYTGPINVNGANSSTTVKFGSWDYQGNVEAVQTQVIEAPTDSAAPTTTMSCNDAACSTTSYVETVTVKLSATDTGGSGVAATFYTTDGSTPTTASPNYTGPFTLGAGSHGVRFFSTDNAGNAEGLQSRQVTVDPPTTRVSLTFDNGALSQYTLGYQEALKPHGAVATFFVNSGTVGVGTNIMTWTQLQTLLDAGNDIGGKSVSSTNLTTDPNPTAQVCDDRAALLQHGLAPVAFAHPAGAFDATTKSIVKACGYGSGRSAGSLSPGGPTYAEALPPVDWFATRAYAPNGQMTLANMKALVNGAASHHGGWSQLVIGRVCSQALEPSNYAPCTGTSGWVELADLNAFLDWMGSAGQTGSAPAGTALGTVRGVATSVDTSTPTTTIACGGSSCASAFTRTVAVTFASTDTGSAVASTHYTTDGTDPSLSSPTYSGPLHVTGTTTIKFRSWDNAGNAEPVNTQVVQVDQPADTTAPTTTITCNGATCATTAYIGTVTVALLSDDDGWGADKTYYTTDGTAPTTASTVYTGPFQQTTSATVRFFSTDFAGNSEQPQAQGLQVQPYDTFVALTFDDQYETFYQYVRPMLRARDMNITIYTITEDSEVPYECCMSYAQLRTMQNEGDDIGGHGRAHLDLTDPSTTTAQKIEDVCGGRQDLIDHGISDPSSFAYPFGKVNAAAEAIVQSCGYDTARQGGALASTTSTPGPRYAEPLPLPDPYAMRAIDVDAPNPKTLADLKSFVTAAAAHGGGLLPITFHQVCDQVMSDYNQCMSTWSAVDTVVLRQFLDWLADAGQPAGAPAGVVVRTVREAVNSPDSIAPSTVASCNGSACSDTMYGSSVHVSLAASDPGGVGVRQTFYTTDGSTPTASSQVYSVPLVVSSTATVKFFSVDNAGNAEAVKSQLVQVDSTPPTTSIACNGGPCSPGSFTSAVQVTLSATDGSGGSGVAATYYTTDGSTPTTASTRYTTGFSLSQTRTVRFFSVDQKGNTEAVKSQVVQFDDAAPTTSIACNGSNCSSGWYVAAVQVTLSAIDGSGGSGVAATYYTTDGSTPTTSSTPYTGAFSVAQTGTVRYFSVDQRGNTEAVKSQLVQVDGTPPTTSIACNGSACSSGWYRAAVAVTLPATDGTGGSGVTATYYTTDGSTPTIAGTRYTGAFSVTQTRTVKYISVDAAGNVEAVKSQLVQVDSAAPTTSIACNSSACSTGWYGAAVQVTLAATDGSGGSGVAATYYTTDGSTPTTSSTPYTGAFSVTQTRTVRYFSVDTAGNAEAAKSQLVRIDAAAPTTTITCNNATCSTGWYRSTVAVRLAATDGTGGSGVAATYYTTDGSTPTVASTRYTGTFNITQTRTVNFFSVDTAGRAEAVKSQVVRIDAAAPTTSIACNGATCSTGWYTATVSVTLSPSDPSGGSGVAATYYTTNGTTPTTASTPYTGAFSVTQTRTVRYISVDTAGNAEAAKSQVVQVDGTAPTSTITCNSATCSSGWYRSTVTVRLAATDGTGGSGVAATYYTTDGSTPTTASARYTGSFTVTQTRTVRFFSVDRAGNAGAVISQLIQVDGTAPTTTISCNGGTCATTSYTSAVSVTLAAVDGSGGSGVASTHYTTDGSTPSLSSPTYSGPFSLSATRTVRFRSWDVAGNVEAVKSQTILVGG